MKPGINLLYLSNPENLHGRRRQVLFNYIDVFGSFTVRYKVGSSFGGFQVHLNLSDLRLKCPLTFGVRLVSKSSEIIESPKP